MAFGFENIVKVSGRCLTDNCGCQAFDGRRIRDCRITIGKDGEAVVQENVFPPFHDDCTCVIESREIVRPKEKTSDNPA